MNCLYCGYEDTGVIDSRMADEGGSIRRRRQCPNCGGKFTTFERVELPNLVVVKRDGSKEPFDRTKIYRSFVAALSKNTSSLNRSHEIGRGVREVEDYLLRQGNNKVTSEVIGNLVMEKLREMDVIAYLRFALVYRHFNNLDEIKNEIRLLEQESITEYSPVPVA